MTDIDVFKNVLERWGLPRNGFSIVASIEIGSTLFMLEKLDEVITTLKAMKQQEFDYWEAWKKAKNKEQNTNEASGST